MSTLTQAREENGQADDHRQDNVTITVDDIPRSIHRGRRTVAEIKTIGQVAEGYSLEQVVEGKFITLGSNDSVVIRGEEVFISVPPGGQSA